MSQQTTEVERLRGLYRQARRMWLGWEIADRFDYDRSAEAQAEYDTFCQQFHEETMRNIAAGPQRGRPRFSYRGLMVAVLAGLLLGAALVSTCLGATAPPSIYPSCPRVIHYLGNKSTPCSGVLVWKSESHDVAQVVTAAHLFTEGVGTVRVSCADGKTYLANVVHIDRQCDFAVLHIRRPLCRVVRFAARLPVAGARLLLGGYPRGGRFRWHGGRFLRTGGRGSFIVQGLSQPGDSGGPILNAQNELVGLIADTHDPATCPNAPNCQHGATPTTGGPTVAAIAAAAKKYQALAEASAPTSTTPPPLSTKRVGPVPLRPASGALAMRPPDT